jgi:hypothetical protein
MKGVNRKVLLSVIGVVLATPFFVAALVISAHLAVLVDGLHNDMLLAALGLGGVVLSIVNGHTHLSKIQARDRVLPKSHTGPRSTSHFNLGY